MDAEIALKGSAAEIKHVQKGKLVQLKMSLTVKAFAKSRPPSLAPDGVLSM